MNLKLLFVVSAFTVSMSTNAQELSYEQMRDSLELAVNELAKQPDSFNRRLKKAGWNLMLEQWAFAQDEYDYVLKRDPDNLAALYFRAYTYQKLHKYAAARDDYKHILRVVPRHFEAQLGLALLNQKDYRYTDAMNGINLLVEQYPDSAVAYAARAGIEVERNMLDQAEYDYSKALELEPGNKDFIMNKFDVLIRMGRKKEARQVLDLAVEAGIPKAALREYYDKCR